MSNDNRADVLLLTPDDAHYCGHVLSECKCDNCPPRIAKLIAIAVGQVICKSAAAEEADRARIAKMRAALSQASFCIRELLPDDPDAKMTVGMINEALSGASENG